MTGITQGDREWGMGNGELKLERSPSEAQLLSFNSPSFQPNSQCPMPTCPERKAYGIASLNAQRLR
jgi:hypothetical protein